MKTIAEELSGPPAKDFALSDVGGSADDVAATASAIISLAAGAVEEELESDSDEWTID